MKYLQPYLKKYKLQSILAPAFKMLEAGFDPALWDRVHAPIGLDIGAETPEELAVAITAELIAVRRGVLRR